MTTELPPAANLTVTDDVSRGEWNFYLQQRDRTIFHRYEWDECFAVYGLKPIRLIAKQGCRITGLLPLVFQKSFLFGRQIVSMPWFDTTGILSDDEETTCFLLKKAVELQKRLNASSLQLRQLQALENASTVRTDKVLMRLTLTTEPEALWSYLKPKVRNQIRKGEKSELRILRGKEDLVDDFFHVYSRNMRDLGSPTHSRKFFQKVITVFEKEATIYCVKLGNRTVGAGFVLANDDCLEIPWASSLRKFNSFCVNHFMYWNILADACRDGYSTFHFGRSSRDSGTYRFKKQWGAEGVPLFWNIFSNEKNQPEKSNSQESFGLARKLWKKLPVSVANRLGPYIIAKVS